MAKNFKIADIKNDSLYSVSLIDNWDGSTEQRKMTGAELVSFTNAFLHLYDIHAEEEKNMTEFTMIKAEVQQDSDKRKENTAFYIENGYFPTWAEEHHTDPERGLRQHSTARRWEQYKAGELVKLWDGWSATTGRHIAAFCGLNKAAYTSLQGGRNDETNF